MLIGAGILVLAVVTDAPTGIARTLPVASHVVLDYVLGLFLIVAPFVFGFAGDDDAATAYFIVLGRRLSSCSRCSRATATRSRLERAPARLDPRGRARPRGAGCAALRERTGAGERRLGLEDRAQRPARAAGARHRARR